MQVDGYCEVCLKWFDGHWNNIPAKDQLRFILQPWCLDCGTTKVHVITDETNDNSAGDDYDE